MTTKHCNRCLQEKKLTAFVKDISQPSGYRKYCKECKNLAFRDRYATNSDCKEKVQAQQKRYRDSIDLYHYIKRYKLNREDIDIMLDNQNGMCPLCERKFTEELKFCVDHNHSCCSGRNSCGKCIRGLLCIPCNGKLAALEDLEWSARASSYVAEYPLPTEQENYI